MSEFSPEIVDSVVAACQAGAEEAASALSRALDGEFSVAVGVSGTYKTESTPDGFDGSGLAVLLKIGDSGAAVILPESSGLLPEWVAAPDVTGESKLNTLAQELGMLLVPEDFMPDDFKAAQVGHLAEALAASGVDESAALVPLEVKQGEQTAELSLIWPLAKPDELLNQSQEQGEEKSTSAPASVSKAAAPSTPKSFEDLPAYTRSLLKVKVPVSVVLAERKQTLKEATEIAPGTLLKFDKACDELLHLCVGDRQVAEGEAVKVGDKFGFRVISMLLPEEHFWKVQKDRAS